MIIELSCLLNSNKCCLQSKHIYTTHLYFLYTKVSLLLEPATIYCKTAILHKYFTFTYIHT